MSARVRRNREELKVRAMELAAKGLTIQQVCERLGISARYLDWNAIKVARHQGVRAFSVNTESGIRHTGAQHGPEWWWDNR